MSELKILVVDDESRMRKLVRDFLVREGYNVLEAEDGVEAMDIFYEEKDISLLILDVMMPRMDGISMVVKLREKYDFPVIFLSAKSEEVDKIADEVIKFERNAVSGISVALGMPGGVAMAATIPADIAQYYGYMIRAAQKLLYLYGFPELDTSDEAIALDTETINSLTVCLGVMYGVANANNAIKAMAKALAGGVEKQLMKKALTKGAIYPIVRAVGKWFGVRMTKEIFAGFFKKAIPVVGGVVGGGITYASFKPCCYRLKDVLQDTMLSNPNHESSEEENKIFYDIEAEYVEVKDGISQSN